MIALLRTTRLVLRRFTRDDDLALHALDSDPEVMRFISKGQPTALEEIRGRVIPKFLNYYLISPPRGYWAAQLLDTQEFIGWFHLRPDVFSADEMELGYRLKRGVWGKGLATEGAAALVQTGLREWGYARISARTLSAHLASQRVMEKVGLVFECDFIYPPEMLPGWTEDERRGVKHSVAQASRGLRGPA